MHTRTLHASTAECPVQYNTFTEFNVHNLNECTGTFILQVRNSGDELETITTKFNSLQQAVSYIDADPYYFNIMDEVIVTQVA